MAKDPDKRAEEREQQIRVRLNDAGGFASGAMKMLDSFFSSYQETPRPELFEKVCASIIDLNLMYLPEHRFGLAGGLAAVVSLHPDRAPDWKKAFPSLITSAEKLMPPIVDTNVSTIGHVEYLWLWWLVTREEAVLTRVIRLSHRPGDVGHMAQALLINHVNIPRIQEVVETEGRMWQSNYQGDVLDIEVQTLAASLAASSADNVFCVGRNTDGELVVVTLDGSRPPACPADVLCRCPTTDERAVYDQLLEEAEDP